MQWLVSQIGSREHYAVPRAFHARGHLWRFYTDVWLGPRAARWARSLPGPLSALATRSQAALPPARVVSFPWMALRHGLAGRFPGRRLDEYDGYDAVGRTFAERVVRHVERSDFDPAGSAAFLFSTGALETARRMRELRVPIVVDQLDPAQLDEQMVHAEAERWPGWEARRRPVPGSYYDRLAEEWRLADRIVVNSQWSRQNLLNQGVDPAKVVVVPLCFEGDVGPRPVEHVAGQRPLTVLWLGQVILRKGIPYLFEAARQLSGTDIRFIVAGRIGISEAAVASAPANVSVMGRVTRAQAARLWSEADLFVLPTLSDGFALTQLEAMAAGLPVVTTPNCGDVVTPGLDGLIVPPGDAAALAEAIRSLDLDRDRLSAMSVAARDTARQPRFSLAGYADAVEAAIAGVPR